MRRVGAVVLVGVTLGVVGPVPAVVASTGGVLTGSASTGVAPLSAPGEGRATVTVGEPSDAAPAGGDVDVPGGMVDLGTVATPLRFEAGPGAVVEVADGRRYLGTLEVRRSGGDQTLVNELTTDDYVAGVAEMPGRWPMEALKAQAVAARTYAWHQATLGTFRSRGYDICDTVDCQVFRGASQQEGAGGERWREAVDATSGQVLLDGDGAPILARYFSTSGGRTLPNEVVFPSSGPRPYLVGIDDPADAASPYHRWRVVFTREEFDAILAAGQRLSAVSPIASVERLGDVEVPGVDLRLTGRDGTEVVIDSVEFRRFVSEVARQRFPDRFPSARADGLRPLPSTLPSSRFTVEVGTDEIVVDGRGWGHAVGMGQYGARGRAEQGEDHRSILAAYYGGIEPTTSDQLPERLRVGIGATAVGSVTPLDAAMRIVADGDELTGFAVGTHVLEAVGDEVRVLAPAGTGTPLTASRTEPADGIPSGPNTVAVQSIASAPAVARLVVTDAAGGSVVAHDLGAGGAGAWVAVWDLTDADGRPVDDGTYHVLVETTDAAGRTAGAPLPVHVTWPTGPVEALTSLVGGPGGSWRTPLVVVAAGLVLVGLLVAGRRRSEDPSTSAPSDGPRRRR